MKFVDVMGYEDEYGISPCGTILNKKNGKKYPRKSRYPYPTVAFYKDGVCKKFLLHRVLATHFIPNPNNLKVINHKDGDPSNFNLENLEWCTPSQNTQHAYDNNLMRVGSEHHKSKLTKDKVFLMRGYYLSSGKSVDKVSKIFKVSRGTAYDAITSKTWKKSQGGPMQNNEITAKLDKHVGVSLTSINWWILCTFLKSVLDDPEKVKLLFSDAGDCNVIELITASISKQFGMRYEDLLKKEEEESTLEYVLKVPPKKLITSSNDIIF